jgi:hypothetical protein
LKEEEDDGHTKKNLKIMGEEVSLLHYGSHVGLGEEHGGGFVEALLIY